ncbi:hypothetical protein SUGI_0807820 [Cryptomeria japonica]|nr:hypothetical protein SUGI_0807820 [Cryptomeria japonica]
MTIVGELYDNCNEGSFERKLRAPFCTEVTHFGVSFLVQCPLVRAREVSHEGNAENKTLLCQHVSKEGAQGSIRSVNAHIVGSYGLQGVALQGCENGEGNGMDPEENLHYNFLLNTSISSLDKGDTFLFLGTNPRVEAPMANTQI